MWRGGLLQSQAIISIQLLLAIFGIVYLDSSFFLPVIAFSMVFLYIGHHAILHRYFSHQSFEVHKWLHIFFSFFGCLACMGSPFAYSVIHKRHHKFSDTEHDPHSAEHIGIFKTLFYQWNLQELGLIDAVESFRDKWQQISHRYYVLVILIFCLGLVAIDFKWLLVYSIAVSISFLCMGYINVFSHRPHFLNYRTHNTRENSHNDYLSIFIGEWHNNHHAQPWKFNTKEQWWELDIAGIFIGLIKK